MGVSTDGQLSFGIAFEEEYCFPWDEEKWEGDIGDWWVCGICGYKPPFELYNSDGGYVNGERPPEEKLSEYYDHRSKFEANNPMPVNPVMHCSYDYPMYIIAVNGTESSNSRGYPTEVNPDSMVVTDEQIRVLVDFCTKYCQPQDEYTERPNMEPKWYLTSLWG